MRAFRRCRGALGISVIWRAAWAAIFAAIVLIVGLVDPDAASVAVAKKAELGAPLEQPKLPS